MGREIPTRGFPFPGVKNGVEPGSVPGSRSDAWAFIARSGRRPFRRAARMLTFQHRMSTRKVCILSLDGGGIRGILPGIILAELEKELKKKDGCQARLADYFDLIAGTSTGGILALGYLVPNENGRPKYEADKVVSLYLENK